MNVKVTTLGSFIREVIYFPNKGWTINAGLLLVKFKKF